MRRKTACLFALLTLIALVATIAPATADFGYCEFDNVLAADVPLNYTTIPGNDSCGTIIACPGPCEVVATAQITGVGLVGVNLSVYDADAPYTPYVDETCGPSLNTCTVRETVTAPGPVSVGCIQRSLLGVQTTVTCDWTVTLLPS